MQLREPVLQPQAGGNEYLVVAAASGVDALAGVAQALDQARLDRGVPLLMARVEAEGAPAEIGGERVEPARQPGQFFRREGAAAFQPLRELGRASGRGRVY